MSVCSWTNQRILVQVLKLLHHRKSLHYGPLGCQTQHFLLSTLCNRRSRRSILLQPSGLVLRRHVSQKENTDTDSSQKESMGRDPSETSHKSAVEEHSSSVEEIDNAPSKTSEQSISSAKGDQQRSLQTVQRIRPAITPEKKEYRLPGHDDSRKTEVHRRLELQSESVFEELAKSRGANKETFLLAINKYVQRESLYRRGAVEFLQAGMQVMEQFGVKKDLSVYKTLLQVFPEGKMIPRNAWQVEFMHYPRQQQVVIDMLEQMEYNAVVPDLEFGRILKDRFGEEAHVTRKYRRMMYWLPKFKNLNPYPIPTELPEDPIQVALIALKRMCVDKETVYTVWQTKEEEEEPEEDTFIASAQSPVQQQLMEAHNSEQPVFVEGPFTVYLRQTSQSYFLLRAEPNINSLMKQKEVERKAASDEDLFEWTNFFEEEHPSELRPILSVHEQEDSTVLALSITGTQSKASAVSWVRLLQRCNPNLAKTPVLFKLQSPEGGEVQVVGDNRPFRELIES